MGAKQIVRISLIAVLASGIGGTGCGSVGDGDVEQLKSPPGFWPSTAVDGPTSEAVGDVTDVPGGFVRVGHWKFRTARRSLVAGACDEANEQLATFRLRVAPFRLMRFEVSNRVYNSCVVAGRCKPPDGDLSEDPGGAIPWNDPRSAARPAAVSQPVARAFCRAYGGELPTYHQWIRAAEGDDGSFGIKSLTDAWVRCELGESLPLCDAVQKASFALTTGEVDPKDPTRRNRPMTDVGASAWDVGPYGHLGLFGGAGEWVRVDSSRSRSASPCASEGLLSDDYIQASYESPPEERVPLMQVARDLSTMDLTAPNAELIAAVQHGQDGGPAGKGRYFTGFRCAFPPRAAP